MNKILLVLVILLAGTSLYSQQLTLRYGELDTLVRHTIPDTAWRTPEEFGAVGDGVTDDADAIRETFCSWNYAAEQSVYQDSVFIKLKANTTYRFNTYPGIYNSTFYTDLKYMYVEGNGATIYVDTLNIDYFLSITGYKDNNANNDGWTACLTDTLMEGAMFVHFDTSITNNAEIGDIIGISNHTGFGGDGRSPSWLMNSASAGEMVEVVKVWGDSIEIVGQLRGSYSVTGTVAKLHKNLPTVIIRNLKIIAKNRPMRTYPEQFGRRGLDIILCKNVILDNVEVSGFEWSCMYMQECVTVHVTNCKARDFLSYPDVIGENYGIALGGCMEGTIANSDFQGGRHGIDIGGSFRMPSYVMRILNNVIGKSIGAPSNYALGSHPAVRDVLTKGNIVYGQIGFRSAHNIIQDNIIIDNGIYYSGGDFFRSIASIAVSNAWCPDGGYNIIQNNYIEGVAGGIYLYNGNANPDTSVHHGSGVIGNYKVEGNEILGSFLVYTASYYESDDYQTIENLIIKNNTFRRHPKASPLVPSSIFVNYGAVDSLYIKNFEVSGNSIRGLADGVRFFDASVNRTYVDKLVIKDNVFETGRILEVPQYTEIDYIDVSGNTHDRQYSGSVDGRSAIEIHASNTTITTMKVLDNTFLNFGNGEGTQIILNLKATNIYRGLNITVNCPSWILESITATNQYILNYTAD